MDFRFALIPAGSADSAGRAAQIAERMRRAVKRDPRGALSEVLGALDGSPAGHHMLQCRNTSRGALLCVDRPEAGLLEALLLLAKDHGLAVYDIDLNRLYDPAGGANVEVLLPGIRLPFLTKPLLDDLVRRPGWPEPEAPYVIVARAEQDYIQAWLEDDGVYHLEYREGGPESHFAVETGDAALVVDVMWAWTNQNLSWRTAVDWMFLDVGPHEHDTSDRREPRSVGLQDERHEDGSHLFIDAAVNAEGDLQIRGHDIAPVAAFFDGEYEWWYTVVADHVPALVTAFGGQPGSDILELLEGKYSGAGAYNLAHDLRASGVEHTFWSWP